MFVTDESWLHPRGVATSKRGIRNKWVSLCPHEAIFFVRRPRKGVPCFDLQAGIVRSPSRLYEVTRLCGSLKPHVRMFWKGRLIEVGELYIQRPGPGRAATRFGYATGFGIVWPIPPDTETLAPQDYVDAVCCSVFTTTAALQKDLLKNGWWRAGRKPPTYR